jgi:adducin
LYLFLQLRTSQDQEHILINPYGLQFNEITASSLLKVDVQGNLIDPGTTNFGLNKAAYSLHSSIHIARPDIRCIIHIHSPSVVAVSSLKYGLLPVSKESCVVGKVSYHDYQGMLVDDEERDILIRDLGPVNKVFNSDSTAFSFFFFSQIIN